MKLAHVCTYFFFLWILAIAPPTLAQTPRAVSTFESIGLYWSPAEGAADNECKVQYRRQGTSEWSHGLPLWYDGRNSEYRGSLVHLKSGTPYDIELNLVSTATSNTLSASTWNENFPVAQTIELPAFSNEPLVINQSGTEDGYVLYTHAAGANAVIDVEGSHDNCIELNGSYVIVRGLTLQNAAQDAILIDRDSHDLVIEHCDISGWGRIEPDGWGVNCDSAINSNYNSVDIGSIARVVVQRNRMHHPRSDSNCWEEFREDHDSFHPRGPQVIHLISSYGNHVFRYNSIYSDADHYFNDTMGAAANYSEVGFPHRDTDIYGNYISHCWDDAIESEGGNQNVRIWGNFMEDCFVGIATATTSIGPIYVWRNIMGESHVAPFNGTDDAGHGSLLKTSDRLGGGRIYVFHNTILQPAQPVGLEYPIGCSSGLGSGGPMINVMSRNNILHIRKNWWDSISSDSVLGDYDYDLFNGDVPAGSEAHGFDGIPIYAPGNAEGEYVLDSTSPGFDAGEQVPNFNDGFDGLGPDVGAHEAGTPAPEFGVDAYLAPPPCRDSDGDGYGNPANPECANPQEDCDDENPEVHPGASEACNEQDDNCDGVVDEGCGCINNDEQVCYSGPAETSGVGPCRTGTQTCIDDSWGTCEGMVLPASEICDDEIDNDCDGLTDRADSVDCPKQAVTGSGCGCGQQQGDHNLLFGLLLLSAALIRRKSPKY